MTFEKLQEIVEKNNIPKVDWKVDYVLTHTCPECITNQLVTYIYPGEEALQIYLNNIADDLEFEEIPLDNENTREITISPDKKIKEIMDSPTYVYKADVIIKTDKGTFNKQIVGINNDRLLTIDNSFIDIRDIRNIELKK